ncbi:hypothetical protein C8R45DRAFT_1138105 [Mycena sanguinolenta]|nr:hypothetical protein C8R45DRAFT_1138105 [Mycena sanguinolenta]
MSSSAQEKPVKRLPETCDRFARYLASCTPPLPEKPQRGANDTIIKHYRKLEEALKLFCILTKRSFFLTLDDTERNTLQELLHAFETVPQDQEVHLDALKKFANLALERGWDQTGAAYELVELADSLHVAPRMARMRMGTILMASIIKVHSVSLPRAPIPPLSEPENLDQYGPFVQDRFFALTKVAQVRPLFVSEKVEFEFFRAMLRFVDGSYGNHKRYNVIYDECLSRNFSPQTEVIINYTPWAARSSNSTKAAQKRPADVELARSDKAKTAKLDVLELRVTSGEEALNEETNVFEEDATLDDDEKGNPTKDPDGKTPLSLITKAIIDLGGNATEAGAILLSIMEHARSGIYIEPRPLYHHSPQSRRNPSTPAIYREVFGTLSTFFHHVTPEHNLWLGLLITPLNPAFGVSHETQLKGGTHAAVVGVIPGRGSHSRALLVWDVHVVDPDLPKSKGSIHKETLATIERARKVRRMPNFYSFWINNGLDINDSAVSLHLSLEQILSMARNGLDIRWG